MSIRSGFYSKDEVSSWKPYITEQASLAEIKKTARDYEVMLLTVIDEIITRYESDPDYHFIDTKLNLITGENFEPAADPEKDFKGKRTIYSWIQGRGLEALAGHVEWLDECTILDSDGKKIRAEKLAEIIREVTDKMEEIRAANNGHLFFSMSTDGRALEIDDEGRLSGIDISHNPINFSDLFYAKGLFAAADYLNDSELQKEAGTYYKKVLAAIETETYLSDQQAFDPKNKVKPVPGQLRQGPWMIALGGISLFMEKEGSEEWFEEGEKFLNHIIDRHINSGQFSDLAEWGFLEIIDSNGDPWFDDGKVLSDTGHALEFIGLALKVLLQLKGRSKNSESQNSLVEKCQEILPRVFAANFDLGFNQVGGIYKAVDLKTKTPINTDMPWWSLPETIRAAAELLVFAPEMAEKGAVIEALCRCSDVFFKNYVNKEIYLMAYQTLDKAGRPIAVIPATPDADPGYHTGLSIIDFLKMVNTLQKVIL
ncbi:MAG: AGE family epimerase/isomerase [Planctomycetota bacterium]|jgi:hypothetical protein